MKCFICLISITFAVFANETNAGHSDRRGKNIGIACRPQKIGNCPTKDEVNKYNADARRRRDYCRNDCKCPGYQKCCPNQYKIKECFPIVNATYTTSTTMSSSTVTDMTTATPTTPVAR